MDVGTNASSSWTRPGSVPSRSDTILVHEVGYNASGWASETIDASGTVNKTYFDHAGRVVKTIENYVDGAVSDGDDKTTTFTYNANGQLTSLKAWTSTTAGETTEWVYGITSPVVSHDLVKEMRFPDASTGAASSTEKDAYGHNQLGEVTTFTDRNGSVHTYTRDVLGRIVSDAITTLGSGVDGTVRRIERAYDGQGNLYLITSYDAASGGNVVNQVQREFNGLRQLTREWQAVGGAVNTSTTPSVQYGYSFAGSGSTNHSRLTSITYPNGRVLDYNYATGLADTISRLSSISETVSSVTTTLESYDYLGLGNVVKRGHAQPGVDLTFIKQSGESDADAGDKYIGLDRFGRIADQRWRTSSADVDRRQYGHDRDGNRLYVKNLTATSWSELYTYEGLNQLTSMERGTLNGTNTALTGSPARSQDWDFDAMGNWESLVTDDGTNPPVTETRTHNLQNEITGISGATTPTYDANGNLTTDEAGRTLKYDAWNRLVEVRNSSSTLVATYRYDGLTRRVRETHVSSTTDLYYSAAWQVLEERVGGNPTASYAWSPMYVDAMIARDRDTDANGTLDERLYVIHDANFNVVALVDTSGAVVERFAYDAFGGFATMTGTFGSRSATQYDWHYQHQGLRFDAATGSYNVRNREYGPNVGRWTQNDPMGFKAHDVNLTRAFSNSPASYIDPSGLWSWRGAAKGTFIGSMIGAPLGPVGIAGGGSAGFIIGGMHGGTPPNGANLPFPTVQWGINPDQYVIPCPKTLLELKHLHDSHPDLIELSQDPANVAEQFHPGAGSVWRVKIIGMVSQNQCAYDHQGRLITTGVAAGTPDYFSDLLSHLLCDVLQYKLSDDWQDYHNNGWAPINDPSAPPNEPDWDHYWNQHNPPNWMPVQR